MIPTSDQLARLPKWAQDYITDLERELVCTREEIESGWRKEPTEFCLQRTDFPAAGGIVNRFLPLHHGDQVWLHGVIITNRDNNCTATTEMGSLVIKPNCSNVVTIERLNR